MNVVTETHSGIVVVRDDLVPGGTKARVLPSLLAPGIEYVYASPAYGYAQVALAHSCLVVGAKATVFTAKRAQPHPRTVEARAAGAKVIMVPTGYLSNVTAKAKAYCEMTGATYLPFGFDTDDFRAGLARIAKGAIEEPDEVWSVAGSGTLTRALQEAWPGARFVAVAIGKESDCGRAEVLRAPESFEQDARVRPPFPSCSNYDAKAWRFITEHAAPGAIFWNVAA